MSLKIILQYISDGLSIITISLCFILKVPQIIKLLNNKSAVGVSFLGLVLELMGYSIMTSYNFVNRYSLLSYLEFPFILIQEYVLIYLVLKYSNMLTAPIMVAAVPVYFFIFLGFMTEIIPKMILSFLVPLCTPVSAFSKMVQLIAILRVKNADSISPQTWLISAFTNFTRVFTVWMDSADSLLLGNNIVATCLSSLILLTTLYYRMNKKKIG